MKMTIDLDELERWVMGEGAPTPSRDILLELIALARKGQFYDEHVLTETANHLAETAKEWKQRAEAYERALREIDERQANASGFDLSEAQRALDDIEKIAREALEAAKKE